MEYSEMCVRLGGLVVFRELLQDPVIGSFQRMLEQGNDTQRAAGMLEAAAAFEAALFEHTACWTDYLENAVLESENICIRRTVLGESDPTLERCLQRELQFLQQLGACRWQDLAAQAPALRQAAGMAALLEPWRTAEADFAADYSRRTQEAGRRGYGMFARYHVFTVQDGRLVPVRHPDPQRLAELPGYEGEREKVIANTQALLDGRPANNVLLYGDAGTGKSSTVKAIANDYAGLGLRLVEVKKNQLFQIPDLLDALAANPLKFILFIDDLSFSANDDNFSALKAILEGSVGGRAGNIAVYATSNRRHLIKETLDDRAGDDIHAADTRQELMSLSARFGLTVTFQRPERERFAHIVTELAARYGVDLPPEQLLTKAEAFAIRSGGRSPRVARQFIELCKAGVLS